MDKRFLVAIVAATLATFALVGCASGGEGDAGTGGVTGGESIQEPHEAAPVTRDDASGGVSTSETDVETNAMVDVGAPRTTWANVVWSKSSGMLELSGYAESQGLPELVVNGVVAELVSSDDGSFTYRVGVDVHAPAIRVSWGTHDGEATVDVTNAESLVEPAFSVDLSGGVTDGVAQSLADGVAHLVAPSKVDALVAETRNGGLYTIDHELAFEGGTLVVRGSVTNNTDHDATDVAIGAVVVETARGAHAVEDSYVVADGADERASTTFSATGEETVRSTVVLTYDSIKAHETVTFEQACPEVTSESVSGTLSFVLSDVIGFAR